MRFRSDVGGMVHFARAQSRGSDRRGRSDAGGVARPFLGWVPDRVHGDADECVSDLMSAVWCILPALKAAEATGVVDPKRVALHGHSWGGYQTAFMVTQTNAFPI